MNDSQQKYRAHLLWVERLKGNIDPMAEQIINMIRDGVPRSHVARELNISTNTFHKLIYEWVLINESPSPDNSIMFEPELSVRSRNLVRKHFGEEALRTHEALRKAVAGVDLIDIPGVGKQTADEIEDEIQFDVVGLDEEGYPIRQRRKTQDNAGNPDE